MSSNHNRMENNQSQHVQTWTNSKTGTGTLSVAKQIEQASNDVKLIYVKNIRQEFGQLLAKIKILLGVSSDMMPTSEEIEIMLNFALDNWHSYSLKEIELAVVTNINHQNHNHVECFGKISVKYLNDCLHEYRETKRRTMLELKRRADSERPRTLQQPDYIVNAKLYDGLVEFIRTQNRFPDFWDWNGVYHHMEAESLLNGITDTFKRELYNKVKDELTGDRINERMKSRSLGDLAGADSMNSEEKIKKECRRIIIKSLLIK